MIDPWILFLYYTLFIDQFYGQVSMTGETQIVLFRSAIYICVLLLRVGTACYFVNKPNKLPKNT